MKPHKHAEVIKAWADGAEIEYLSERTNCWWSCPSPDWLPHIQYRIKPQELTVMYIVEHLNNFRFPEHWETPNLKLTFDGITTKLKKAEVIS